MKNILISPPFGIYIPNTPWSTSIRGTYTLEPRKGVYSQALKTFRKIKGGYINKMGFRNKGIKSELKSIQKYNKSDKPQPIWSIGAINQSDWMELFQILEPTPNIILEINLGCPNVDEIMIPENILHNFAHTFDDVIVKLPANIHKALIIAMNAYNSGIRTFHCCNTIKTAYNGGISSRDIKGYSIPLIIYLKKIYPDINIIGGGGIYHKQDVLDYKIAGADFFSISTALIRNPLNIINIIKEIYKLPLERIRKLL